MSVLFSMQRVSLNDALVAWLARAIAIDMLKHLLNFLKL